MSITTVCVSGIDDKCILGDDMGGGCTLWPLSLYNVLYALADLEVGLDGWLLAEGHPLLLILLLLTHLLHTQQRGTAVSLEELVFYIAQGKSI